MSAAFGLLFVVAQGAAIFLTAWAMCKISGATSWWAKIGTMVISYLAWIVFTYAVFFAGADSYVLFAGAIMTSALSSVLFCAAWVVMPLMRSGHNV